MADVYALIEQLTLEGIHAVTAVCETLEVSRAGYYAWRTKVETARERRERELMPLVCNVFWRHRRRYGARRIALEMAATVRRVGPAATNW